MKHDQNLMGYGVERDDDRRGFTCDCCGHEVMGEPAKVEASRPAEEAGEPPYLWCRACLYAEAGPDLLLALKSLRTWVRQELPITDLVMTALLRQAEEAIAKAEGR